ncbi:MAG: polysaccharide biosynthesis protein, partial [Alistipes sp.]|nr:polysaccharide biosynthesis protein [Alistipes sp.]
MVLFTLLVIARVIMITIYETLKQSLISSNSRKNIFIYGTTDKSTALKVRLLNSKHYHVVGFMSSDFHGTHGKIAGATVYQFVHDNKEQMKQLFAMHNIAAVLFPNYTSLQEEQEQLVAFCTSHRIKVLIAPPIDEVVNGNAPANNIREIKIEDLLGRDEIKIPLDEVVNNFKSKVVMVTGAAGSIGSELCRQLSSFGIQRLVMFDNAETPMHNIRLELEETFPALEIVPIVGDVRQPKRLEYVFAKHKPQIVFHAAAYKHVPLMEENPCEAVLVNVDGSRNVADACVRHSAEMMVMISTDKAVNPTNIMGCTKRLAEIYVQSLGTAMANGEVEGKTKFVTTRFGNVLGSNGSVIPRFREQIIKGGPVTVTHPDITRFFMTIPEACQLVMEAATLSDGNQIFVFDMGKSVKIVRLAER